MQAIMIDAPMRFSMRTVPDPLPEIGGGLVCVAACGLCGSDVRTLRFGHSRVTFPWIIGHEFCGEILSCPDGNPAIKKGTLISAVPVVTCGACTFCLSGDSQHCSQYQELAQHWSGAFAQKIALPAQVFSHGSILPLPDAMSPILATLAEPLAAVTHAHEIGGVSANNCVAVIGSGPVGCMHIALAKHSGVQKTMLIDIGDQRLALAEPFGADMRINSSHQDPLPVVKSNTNGLGADVVIVAAAAPNAVHTALNLVRKGGTVILFAGLPAEHARLEIDINDLHYRGIRLIGSTIYAPRHHRMALDLLENGLIQQQAMITTFPLSEFEQGVHAAMHNEILKAVFIP